MADYDASIRVHTAIDNSDIKDAEKEVDRLSKKLEQLHNKGNKLEALGVDKQSKQWQSLKYDVAQVEGALYEAEEALAQIVASNADIVDMGEGFEQANASAKKLYKTVESGQEKANSDLRNMSKMMVRIMAQMLLFRTISATLKFVGAGIQNLSQYSERLNSVLSDMKSESATLKNSLAAAFEPIATMIIPYITTLISWLNTAMNYLTQFWAALSGKSTYTRAKKQVVDYAKSLKDASGSAKGALATFDEINVLNKDTGGGAGGEASGADAFEEAEVDQSKFAWVGWLRDNLDTILGIVELIGIGFLAWKLEGAIFANLDKLTAILGHLNLIFGVAMAAAGAFILLKNVVDAWQNGIDWDNLNGMLIGATLLVVGLGLAFGGVGFVVGALIAGILLLVVGFKDAMNNGLNLKNTLAIIAGTFLVVLAAVNSVFGSIVTLMAGVALLIVSFKDMMENGVNLQNSLMAIAGTFLTVSSIAGAAIGAIASLVAGLVLAIVADWNNFKQVVVVPLQAWLKTLLANVGETFEGIKGFLRGIIQFLKGVFTADWRLAWNGIKNIFNGIWKAISGTVKLVVNAIIGIINTMVNGLAGAINAVINAINSMSFTVPDWVPFFGGETYQGFNIPTLPAPTNIPYLEYGGTVTQETYAKISEGNRKEVVLPLEQHTEWADLLADKIGTRGTTVIRFEGSLAELGRVLKPVIDSENSRIGVSLAQN